MSKDPAFLFYPADFIIGTVFMSNDQIGKYIKLLCFQHQLGPLTERQMLDVCRDRDPMIFDKFKCENGLYFNERLRTEAEKRKSYSLSRSENRKRPNKKAPKVPRKRNDNAKEKWQAEEFEKVWADYPKPVGKKDALRHFRATVHGPEDLDSIKQALVQYKGCKQVSDGFVQNGSTWFNNWQDWLNVNRPAEGIDKWKTPSPRK